MDLDSPNKDPSNSKEKTKRKRRKKSLIPKFVITPFNVPGMEKMLNKAYPTG